LTKPSDMYTWFLFLRSNFKVSTQKADAILHDNDKTQT